METKLLKSSHSKLRYILSWLSIAGLIIAIDRYTKILALKHLTLFNSKIIFSFLSFTIVFNKGAAFSFLSKAGGWQNYVFMGIAVVMSLAILIWMFRLSSKEKATGFSLALVLGGALGNLWDRFSYSFVIDFIDVHYQQWHWPIFNIADAAITLGAALLIIGVFMLSE